jgi:hypothetical protein
MIRQRRPARFEHALLPLALACSLPVRSAAAQSAAVPPIQQGPARVPSLVWPRFELLTGVTLVLSAFPIGAFVSLALGPDMAACLNLFADESRYDPEQVECERKASIESAHGARVGTGIGLAIGMVGLPLMLDGAIRTKRAKAARRSARLRFQAWQVHPGPQRATSTLEWRF